MTMKYFSLYILALLAVFSMACSQSGTIVNTGDSSVSDPDNDAAANVGPASQIIAEDILAQLNEIINNVDDEIEDNVGTDTGDGDFLVLYEVGDDDTFFEVVVSSSESCTDSGTKTVSGSLDYIIETETSTGTITGSFTTTYSNCSDATLVEASNQNCIATPKIDGSFDTIIDVDFGSFDTFEDAGLDVSLNSETTSDGNVDITFDSNETEQSYDFDYAIRSSTSGNGLTGTIRYDSQTYSITDLADFMESASSSVVCD
jgi:hypothetical protein